MADLQMELAHLAQVNAHIADGELRVANLERLVAMFNSGGYPSPSSQTLEIMRAVLVTLRDSRALALAAIADIEAGRR